jgi:hypothetical protein
MAICSMGEKMSAVFVGSGALFSTKVADAEAALLRTPGQILGPFFPLGELSQNSDLIGDPDVQRSRAEHAQTARCRLACVRP